ncbi:hypothetical protein FM996_00530 [Methylosinus sporium]|uniref:Uncharacterized protein n=1 Tax=Methylosinus sporium TaxID=428 RepID=A0A549T8Z7_METSR|nr:hypothetical protein [Methylosinus sporium]TRL38349.1 hypothetical protein FM996_00530 [Methylosinus sporium]
MRRREPLQQLMTRRRRKSARVGHPGTEAQPFFYSSADEALERRGHAMEDVIPDAAGEDGWEVG